MTTTETVRAMPWLNVGVLSDGSMLQANGRIVKRCHGAPLRRNLSEAEAVSLVGATPVFAEIDPVSFCLDPASARAALTPRTRALVPVHLFGHPADMTALRALARERGLLLLEDAAQAFGAVHRGTRIGGLGEIAAFSFFPSKNLGAFGEAGLIATDDEKLADSVRSLRAHGSRQRYVNTEVGYNARLETGTVNGGMTVDFPVTVRGRIGRRVETQLGSGGPLVRAITTNGGVKISER